MPNNKLVYYGYDHPQISPMIEAVSAQLNLEYHFEEIVRISAPDGPQVPTQRSPYRLFLKTAADASMICMWNGKHRYGPLLTDLCAAKAIPKFYVEYGLFPHRDNILVDPMGSCGGSILKQDLSWVTQADFDALAAKRAEMQGWYPIEDDGSVMIPLQIETDPQVLYYTKYRNMHEFVHDVIEMYPNNRIVVKEHPKETASFSQQWLQDNPDSDVEFVAGHVDFLRVAASASVVVGLTSTTLYEAGVLGKPIVALGQHPLAGASEQDKERVLAGALALNVNMQTGSIKTVLDRFGIQPL
jgi:hypothetical protein